MPTLTQDVHLMPSGKMLEFSFSLSGNKSMATAVTATEANLPSYRVNGGSPVALKFNDVSKIHWNKTTHCMPSVVFLLGVTLADTDVVEVSTVAGWVTTADGTAPAVTDGPVVNLVGGTLLPDPLSPAPTMGVGWNINQTNDHEGGTYTNLYAQSQFVDDFVAVLAQPAIQLANWMTAMNGTGDSTKAWPLVPNRRWCLSWDGAADAQVVSSGFGTCTEDVAAAVITHGANNRRYYTTGGDARGFGCDLQSLFTGVALGGGNYNYDITRFRFVPDDVDADNPPLFSAEFLARTSPVQCLRWLDPQQAIAGNGTDFADYQSTRKYSRWVPLRTVTATIATIRQYTYTPGDPWPRDFPAGAGLFLRVATTAPHGFSKWQWATLNCPVSVTLSDSSTLALDGQRGFLFPLSDTEFVFFCTAAHGLSMVGTASSPGTIGMTVAPIAPLSEVVAACNDANADYYFNWCFSATDACLASITDYVARHLKPGLKFRNAASNETWNNSAAGSVGPYVLACLGSYLYYGNGGFGDPQPFTIEQSHRVWTDVMLPAWVAAGRDPADFKRVAETQHGNPGQITGTIGAYNANNGWTFDELSPAPYGANAPSTYLSGGVVEAGFPDFVDAVNEDAELALDYLEIHRLRGSYEIEFPFHAAQLVSHGYTAPVDEICYEGGMDTLYLAGGSTSARYAEVQNEITRHPRYYRPYQHHLKVFQDSGCKLLNHYKITYIPLALGTPWSAYVGPGQLAYSPGDPPQDAIQVDTPNDLIRVRSVIGGAHQGWGATLPKGGSGTMATTVLHDTFTGTAGAPIIGAAPAPVRPGSEVWGAGPDAAGLVYAAGGGAQSAAANASISIPLAGAGGVQTITSVVRLAALTGTISYFLRANDGAFTGQDLINLNLTLGAGSSDLLTLSGGSNLGDPATAFAWATGVDYTVIVTLGATTATVTVDSGSGPTTLFDHVTIPASSLSELYLRQLGAAANGVLFRSIQVDVPSASATTFTGAASPGSIALGASTTVTMTPDAAFTGTLTATPGGSASAGLAPIVKTFSGTSTGQSGTFTPTVAGTLTVTYTNSGSLTDPGNSTVAVSASASAASFYADNPALFFAPYSAKLTGSGSASRADQSQPGDFLKAVLNGASTTLGLLVDGAKNFGATAGATPVIAWTINDGPIATHQLGNSTNSLYAVDLTSGSGALTGTADRLHIWFKAGSITDNRATTTLGHLVVQGLTADPGATLGTYTPLPKRLIGYGDSITEGVGVEALFTSWNDLTPNTSYKTWLPLVADALGAEYGQIAGGGEAMGTVYAGNIGPISTSWPFYASADSRLVGGLFAPQPDYVLCNGGQNDTSDPTAAYTLWLSGVRAAAPNAHIFIVGTITAKWHAEIAAFATAAALADPRVHWVDPALMNAHTGPNPTDTAFDGTHQTAYGHSIFAAFVADRVRAALGGHSTSTGRRHGQLARGR